MKKTNFVLLFIFAAMCLFAQNVDKPVLVITPVDLYDMDEKSGELLFRRMQSEFANMVKFKVVDRGSFEKLRKEQEFQGSDWSNPDKIAEMKKAFNAKYIVTSTVESYGDDIYITVNIIDVNTTQIVASENLSVKSIKELMDGKLKKMIENVTKKVSVEGVYTIGERSPSGGIVFYYSREGFNVYDAEGNVVVAHYMECSDVLSKSISWCSRKESASCCEPKTETGFGYGKANTMKILTTNHAGGALSETNCAALLCSKYSTINTKTGDWWLPSKDELNLIYTNLKCKGYISDSSYFWSSSSYSNSTAWYQSFYSGDQNYDYKHGRGSVRAVRAF
ncbi:MAG: DUF1566 domain-containing protein [Spirochaetales bacterium]|nr:DUF1566 domain-containing protein [Spirochaetales bacterium]